LSPTQQSAPSWVSPARIAATLVVFAGVSLASVYAYKRIAEAPPALDVYGELPDFALTAQDESKVQRESLAGRVVIANFIFTRCPTVCPTFTMKMKRVAERLADTDVRLISFSVDPEFDSPEVLARFATKFKVNPEQWSFLTGDPDAIKKRVADGLALALEERGTLPNGVPDIVHGTHFVLIDQKHQIRGYYNADTIERIDALVSDARALAE